MDNSQQDVFSCRSKVESNGSIVICTASARKLSPFLLFGCGPRHWQHSVLSELKRTRPTTTERNAPTSKRQIFFEASISWWDVLPDEFHTAASSTTDSRCCLCVGSNFRLTSLPHRTYGRPDAVNLRSTMRLSTAVTDLLGLHMSCC